MSFSFRWPGLARQSGSACACGCVTCSFCTGAMPSKIQITFTGVTDGSGSVYSCQDGSCAADFNATFLLPHATNADSVYFVDPNTGTTPAGMPTYTCAYFLMLPFFPCPDTGTDQMWFTAWFAQDAFYMYLNIRKTATFGGAVTQYESVQWKKTYPSAPYDCGALNDVIPIQLIDSIIGTSCNWYCGFSASTAKGVAIA